MADESTEKALLGEWLAMDESERKDRKLPTTQTEMAKFLGVVPRTVIRWKKSDPLVAGAFQKAKEARGKAEPVVPERKYPRNKPFAPPEQEPEAFEGDPLTAEFEEIRKALVREAKDGGKGLDTYMRHIGKHILEQERAARESGFSDLTDDELVDEILSLIGKERVRAWQRSS